MIGWGVGGSLAFGAVGLGSGAIWIGSTPGADQKRDREYAFFQGLPPGANIAHRGASGRAMEHSLQAYRLALQAGADVLELDVRQLRDGVLVVAHDADLSRILGLPAVLGDVTWPQLQALEVAHSSALPHRLFDLLTQFPLVRFNLEIKDAGLGAAARLAEVITEAEAGERVLVASMHHDALVEFRRLTGGRVATSASGREVLRFFLGYRLGFEAPTPFAALQLPPIDGLGLAKPAFLSYAHSRELFVHYWTIDKANAQRRLLEAGADGIMTNYPAVLRTTARLLHAAGTQSRGRP